MRKVALLTTSRADYGIYRPLLKAISEAPDLELLLVVSGMHLAPEFGLSVSHIEEDPWPIAERVETLMSSDTALGTAQSLGLAVTLLGSCWSRLAPDLLVVLGDRFEMFAGALAALPLRLPVVHLHGGELTLGAQDDALRHAMTKLSHLHMVATTEYARRVEQLGEEPWRITVCGALSLDNLDSLELLSKDDLARELDLPLDPPPLLVTFHPVTLAPDGGLAQARELLDALAELARPCIFTLPNADAGGRALGRLIRDFAGRHSWAAVRDNLGARKYFSLMAGAAAMLGNSSSGLIEAPSLGLPVVNLGSRQAGRVRGANVIQAEPTRQAILTALNQALDPAFTRTLADKPNPYYHGGAADLIMQRLGQAPLDQRLIAKSFVDWPRPGENP